MSIPRASKDINDRAIVPGIYRHYKGQDYQVIDIARHSETEEVLVAYRCLYGDYSLWVRPLDMFKETIEIDGEQRLRFQLISTAGE